MFYSPVPVMADAPTGVVVETSSAPARNAANQPQEHSSVARYEFGSAPSPAGSINKPTITFESVDMSGPPAASRSDCFPSTSPASSATICFSSSDPVLVLSSDSLPLSTLGIIKREVGGCQASAESDIVVPTERNLASGQDFEKLISFGDFYSLC